MNTDHREGNVMDDSSASHEEYEQWWYHSGSTMSHLKKSSSWVIDRYQVFDHVENFGDHHFFIADGRQPQKINGEFTTLVAPLNHDFTVNKFFNWSRTGSKLVVGSVWLGYNSKSFAHIQYWSVINTWMAETHINNRNEVFVLVW